MSNQSTEVVPFDGSMLPGINDTDPDAVMDRFSQRFMAAESIQDLFRVLAGHNSKELVGSTLEIRGVQWQWFEADGGPIPNAICEAVDVETGELTEFATTSGMLVRFLARAQTLGAFPFTAKITSKKTRQGRDALNFEAV